jgi:hypothetical protein
MGTVQNCMRMQRCHKLWRDNVIVPARAGRRGTEAGETAKSRTLVTSLETQPFRRWSSEVLFWVYGAPLTAKPGEEKVKIWSRAVTGRVGWAKDSQYVVVLATGEAFSTFRAHFYCGKKNMISGSAPIEIIGVRWARAARRIRAGCLNVAIFAFFGHFSRSLARN